MAGIVAKVQIPFLIIDILLSTGSGFAKMSYDFSLLIYDLKQLGVKVY